MKVSVFGRYIIYSDGVIWSGISKRFLKPQNINGYLCVVLHKKRYRIHRLVAESFIPNSNNKPFINHKDGNKLNNDVNNLEWVTKSENFKHAFKLGLRNHKGENHPYSKLTEEQVKEIRYNYRFFAYTLKELAQIYGITKQHCGSIINRNSWNHI